MPDIVELNLPMSDRTDPQLSFNTRSGGVALDGTEQIISPLSERWRFSASFPIRNAAGARSIRRAKSLLKGRFNYLLLRICDQYRITRRDLEGWPQHGQTPHSDQTPFSDYSAYGLAQPKSVITVAAVRNAGEISIRASDLAGAMSSGVFFSINYFLYQVDNWELVGPNYVLQVSPPLREPVAVGDEVDFDAKSLWRLESDDEGALNLQYGRFGTITLNLVEPIGRGSV